MTGRRGPSGPERRGGPGNRSGLPRRPGGRDAGGAPSGAIPGGLGGESPAEPEALRALRRVPFPESRPAAAVVARGTLRRVDVETRPLVLDAEDGTRWELLLPAGWEVEAEPGARVTVSGDPVTDMATTSMVGPLLRVRSLSRGD